MERTHACILTDKTPQKSRFPKIIRPLLLPPYAMEALFARVRYDIERLCWEVKRGRIRHDSLEDTAEACGQLLAVLNGLRAREVKR